MLCEKWVDTKSFSQNQMNQADFENFVLCIANYNNPDTPIREASVAKIQELQNQNPFGLLAALLLALQNEQVPIEAKRMALVISNELLNKLEVSDSTLTKYQFIEKSNAGLLNNYLAAATAHFAVDPNLSGHLFATLAIIFCEYLELGENNQIIQTVLKQLNGMDNYQYILAAFVAFEEITNEIDLSQSPDIYQPTLMLIFTLFGKPEVPLPIKVKSLNILNNLIVIIDEVFQSEQNRNTILAVIRFSINMSETKISGYHCLSKILKHYFVIFVGISQEVLPICIQDLTNHKDDSDIVIAICKIIKNLCKYSPNSEEEQQVQHDILSKCFLPFLQSLIPISIDHEDQLNEVDEYNSQIEAIDTISTVIKSLPTEACPVACQIGQEHIQSENPCLRELSLTLFRNVIEATDDLSLTQTLLQSLFPAILNDPSPRVREASIYILLLVVSQNNENFSQFIAALPQHLLNILPRDIEFPVLASSICDVISRIEYLQSPETVISLLIKFSEINNPIFLESLFSCISAIIRHTKNTSVLLSSIVPQIVELVHMATINPVLIPNQNFIFYPFDEICSRAKEAMRQYFEVLYKALTRSLESVGNVIVFNALSSLLSSVSFTQPEAYFPYLQDLMPRLLTLAQRFDSNEHIFALTFSLATLNKTFDLSHFIPTFTEALVSIMSQRENDWTVYKEILDVLNYCFFRRYKEFMVSFIPALIKIISAPLPLLIEYIPYKEETEKFIFQAALFLLFVFTEYPVESQQWTQIALMVLIVAANCVDVENDLKSGFGDDNDPDVFTQLLAAIIACQVEGSEDEEAIYGFMKANSVIIEFLFNLKTRNDASNHDAIDTIFQKAQIDLSQLQE